jgi:class 3 adenylate cyclase
MTGSPAAAPGSSPRDATVAHAAERRGDRTADRTTARAATIVDDVLSGTVRRNERGVAWGRLAVCLAFLVREFAFYADSLFAGQPDDVVAVVALVIGVVVSAAHLWAARGTAGPPPPPRTTLSVLVDILVWGATLWTQVLYPGPHYYGVFGLQGLAVGVLVVTGAGLRLERGPVVASALGAFAVIAGAAAYDKVVQASVAFWGGGSVVFFAIVFGGAAYLGDLVARRTRAIALDAARQAFDAERARERFGAYVGAEVAALALASRDVVLGGRRQPVAVLFSDLRGFTSASEHAQPEDVVRQLNGYFEVMVAVIEQHGGVVDKYVGDGIMAVFGAPSGRTDDARRAVQAALAMRPALAEHNARRQREGLSPLQIGVGVHFGEVVAGNIGTTRAAQYTVIGDVVNLASRLESATRDRGVTVLCSDAVVDAAHAAGPALPLRALGTITVKGRAAGVVVYGAEDEVAAVPRGPVMPTPSTPAAAATTTPA